MWCLHKSDCFTDPAFPLACWIDERHGDMEIHTHDFHELVLILSGHGRHLVCGRGYDLEAGCVYFSRQFRKVMGVSPSKYRRRHADRAPRRTAAMKENRNTDLT